MKKMLLLTAALILTLSLGTAAFAASPSAKPAATFACPGNANCQYVDADNDGICDNCGTQCNFVDADGDGICDNRGTRGANFVDADNDGVCDNRNSANAGRANGAGCGRGAGARSGGSHGRNHR